MRTGFRSLFRAVFACIRGGLLKYSDVFGATLGYSDLRWAKTQQLARMGSRSSQRSKAYNALLDAVGRLGWVDIKDALAERSKAVAQGTIPKGRGLEPHRRQILNMISCLRW